MDQTTPLDGFNRAAFRADPPAQIPAGTPGGLASEAVSALRDRYGPNSLTPERIRPWWLRLGAKLTHFFALMLWAAAALAVAAGTPELGWAIAAVVVVNALFAFFQEARAERAAATLVCLTLFHLGSVSLTFHFLADPILGCSRRVRYLSRDTSLLPWFCHCDAIAIVPNRDR